MLRIIVLLALSQQIWINNFSFKAKGEESENSTKKSKKTTTSTARWTKTRGRYYNPNFGYEPYWPGGEWVLYGDPEAPSTTQPPQVCGEECHYLYRDNGKICAREINNVKLVNGCYPWLSWKCYGDRPDNHTLGYQTFNSYCEFLDKQCRSAGRTKPPINKWIFVHLGECVRNQNLTFKQMFRDEPVSRMWSYLSSQAKVFEGLPKDPC